MGLKWFVTFDAADAGLLQGNLGRSMESNLPVNEILGDRLALTFVVSVLTILFTWAIAIPIGIYSAIRPYSIGDYVLTLVGFIGVSIPPFLFALVLMYLSGEYFGISVSGLFSARYAADPIWSWGKVVDLLQHVWVAVLVLGVGSTAVMIRVMRANLLDELKKPYVVAARAKGVRPFRLLMKYPVRIALNPFVSGLAALFPQLVSGGAIVALVLSLPTIGPILMTSLMNEDTYFAASMLMILSVLGAVGTLLSDLLLLWLDPRIRLSGGSR
jgi:ABC-type dipeptide/oligopeptide/nickel transport system permease component